MVQRSHLSLMKGAGVAYQRGCRGAEGEVVCSAKRDVRCGAVSLTAPVLAAAHSLLENCLRDDALIVLKDSGRNEEVEVEVKVPSPLIGRDLARVSVAS
jgi:hypothetical protein